MADLLNTAASWLDGMFKAHASRSVTYQREGETVSVDATPGRTPYTVELEGGIAQQIESADWIIDAADLVLGGEQTEPQRGDRVIDTLNGQQLTYEVLAPGNEPVFVYDRYRRRLRVHSKLIDEEASA